MSGKNLVLAGGGHTHALILLRWIMHPQLRPAVGIMLINRASTTFYSGMMPGVISKQYSINESLIDIRLLAERARVTFIRAEIIGLDVRKNLILLKERPPISFTELSLDIGSETKLKKENLFIKSRNCATPIKPFEAVLNLIALEDDKAMDENSDPFSVVGSGLSALEVTLALRQRWPKRPIQLHAYLDNLNERLKASLKESNIYLMSSREKIPALSLLCTGSQSPEWLRESGLSLDSTGRVCTADTLQVIGHPNLFAAGDCAVVQGKYRPPSGVWAVRAANPLAKNLERSLIGLPLLHWFPQRYAMQLVVGISKKGKPIAWCCLGKWILGPNSLFWKWKETIDRKFMSNFSYVLTMKNSQVDMKRSMECRGCAAKLPEEPLKNALKEAGLSSLCTATEDSVEIGLLKGGRKILQSVDGFPALLTDPWLNARLTTLHACSDLWASGAVVTSAQALITLPSIAKSLQEKLLIQILDGMQSALRPQGAELLGGHTMESRNDTSTPFTLDIGISVCVNGLVPSGHQSWLKRRLQIGDDLLISRPLGTGVLFAGFKLGLLSPYEFDRSLSQINCSQHNLLNTLIKMESKSLPRKVVHACTDITGFGLLGHLGEMITSTNYDRMKEGLLPISIKLFAEKIPSYGGVLDLFYKDCFSSLASSNRKSWKLLQPDCEIPPPVELILGSIPSCSKKHKAILELLVDPQTCGPLLLSCSKEMSSALLTGSSWSRIGEVV